MADGGIAMSARPRIGRPPTRATAAYTSRYADDVGAQRLVELHPDGVPYEVIAEHLGLSREGARLICEAALRALAPRLALAGIDAGDLAGMLASRREESLPDHTGGKPSKRMAEAREAAEWARVGTGPQAPSVLALCEGLDSIAETARARRDVARVVEGLAIAGGAW